MKKKLSILLCGCCLLVSLVSCSGKEKSPPPPAPGTVQSSDTTAPRPASLLLESEDMGEEYIDSFIFFGESTTYHMKSRGVLRGGTDTRQVWAPENGTVNLDPSITSLRIVYPETGELITLSDALKRSRPRRMMLTFGLNGAVGNVKRGADYFKSCYRSLLDLIRNASPETEIFLQSAFPVASNMDMSRYSVTLDTLNENIDCINGWTAELAEEYGIGYLHSAEILKDENGRLKSEYQVGDGHHLTAEAYRQILAYIRTHTKAGGN